MTLPAHTSEPTPEGVLLSPRSRLNLTQLQPEMKASSLTPTLEQIACRLIDQPEEGPADAIPGLLPKQGQLVISGETNVGKSLLSLEIASALATGQPLWGSLEPTMRARKVLYILGEHYVGVIQRLLQVTRLPMPETAYILGPEQLGFDKWLVGHGKPNSGAISKFQRWAEGVDLIVWDPLSSFVLGSDAENDNVGMRLVLDMMSLVSQTSGSSCLVLAHHGKPSMDRQGNEHTRSKYATRGASGVEDAATNIFYFTQAEQLGQKAGEGKIFDLTLRKYKGIAPERYRLLRDPETLTHSVLGHKTTAQYDIQKSQLLTKIHRLQVNNEKLEYRTCIKLVASMEGLPEETVKRLIGLTPAGT